MNDVIQAMIDVSDDRSILEILGSDTYTFKGQLRIYSGKMYFFPTQVWDEEKGAFSVIPESSDPFSENRRRTLFPTRTRIYFKREDYASLPPRVSALRDGKYYCIDMNRSILKSSEGPDLKISCADLIIRDEDNKPLDGEAEHKELDSAEVEPEVHEGASDVGKYADILTQSKNLIFHGAPGTGKSYLAKQIAARIVSGGECEDYSELSEAQRERVEFVQFHPSYDYSDFVEGLRPRLNDDGSLGFELQDGVFKRFVARARENYEDSRMTDDAYRHKVRVQMAISDYRPNKRERGCIEQVRRMLLAPDWKFDSETNVAAFFRRDYQLEVDGNILLLYNRVREKLPREDAVRDIAKPEMENFVFIIDEINRGEISKIFGELFFSIDPDYRGRRGEVSTQYANLHANPNERFYIPENVYIIGTMNDIDRSVDSFDFAMRRRFRFLELKAVDLARARVILADLGEQRDEAIRRMICLNAAIARVDELNENYQIGAAYFRKLKDMSFDELWTDNLQPLLHEYVRGMFNEKDSMDKFAYAYGYSEGDGE